MAQRDGHIPSCSTRISQNVRQIVTGSPEQQHGRYLNDAHQGRFHHQDALSKDGDGVSKLGNLQQRERRDEGLHGKEPSQLCKAKQPVNSLQGLQEMNVWLCKGHWCACSRDEVGLG